MQRRNGFVQSISKGTLDSNCIRLPHEKSCLGLWSPASPHIIEYTQSPFKESNIPADRDAFLIFFFIMNMGGTLFYFILFFSTGSPKKILKHPSPRARAENLCFILSEKKIEKSPLCEENL